MSQKDYSCYSKEELEKLLEEVSNTDEAHEIFGELEKRCVEELLDLTGSQFSDTWDSFSQPTEDMKNNQQIREEMTQLQAELEAALDEIIKEVGKKFKPNERKEIEREFAEMQELLERLKEGFVWVSLFGKTSVGKSATANSLIGEDLAKVDARQDATTVATSYRKGPWMIVDVPGILGKDVNAKLAIEEARKSHGHLFMIDGEPLEAEMKLFNLINDALPTTPKIVFVNKFDVLEFEHTEEELANIRQRIFEKMGKFVKSPSDIIYGSAQLKDPIAKCKVRQDLPDLLDRMYESAGTLGEVMNVLDPAKRASDLNQNIQDKILAMREKVARKLIGICAYTAAFNGAIPFSTILVTPGMLTGMVYGILRIMGIKWDKARAEKLTHELLKMLGTAIKDFWLGITAAELAVDLVSTALAPGLGGLALGAVADVAFFAGYKYHRATTLGEITLEYIHNKFSWGMESQTEVIKRCQERAQQTYTALKKDLDIGKQQK